MFTLPASSSSSALIFLPLFTICFLSSSSLISGGGSSSSGVHFDHYQRCYASLEKEKVFEGCLKKAEDKWNLTKQSDETAAKHFSTSVEIVQRSCCAMYEALNCAQNRSCQFCADEVLDGKILNPKISNPKKLLF